MARRRRDLGGVRVDLAKQGQVQLERVRLRVRALALAAEGDGAVAGAVGAELDVRVFDVLPVMERMDGRVDGMNERVGPCLAPDPSSLARALACSSGRRSASVAGAAYRKHLGSMRTHESAPAGRRAGRRRALAVNGSAREKGGVPGLEPGLDARTSPTPTRPIIRTAIAASRLVGWQGPGLPGAAGLCSSIASASASGKKN